MRTGFFVTTAFVSAFAAFTAAADTIPADVPTTPEDCDNRPETEMLDDARAQPLEDTVLKVGCLLSLSDRGLVDLEVLKEAIRGVQRTMDNIINEGDDHNIEIADNYEVPDGVIGPLFLEDFAVTSSYTSFSLPFLPEGENAYGDNNINSYYMQRFVAELRAQDPEQFDVIQTEIYYGVTPEEERFLDDQIEQCTGQDSLLDYRGPCGNSTAYLIEESLHPSQTTVTYGAKLTA